jgi:hypothetical protein
VAVLSRGRVGSLLLLPLVGAAVMGRVGRRRALRCLLVAITVFIAVKALSSSTKSKKKSIVLYISSNNLEQRVISFDLIRVIVNKIRLIGWAMVTGLHLVHVLSDLICEDRVFEGHELLKASLPIRVDTYQKASEEGSRIIEQRPTLDMVRNST